MMKLLLEHVVAAALEASKPIQALALGVKELANQVVILATALQKVADQQVTHDKVIAKLWSNQQALLDELCDKMTDGRVSVRRDDKDAGDKPN